MFLLNHIILILESDSLSRFTRPSVILHNFGNKILNNHLKVGFTTGPSIEISF